MAADGQDGGHLDLPMTRGLESKERKKKAEVEFLDERAEDSLTPIPVNEIAAAVLHIGLFVCIIK